MMAKTLINTVVIEPALEMPREVFLTCHRLATYMELMERRGPHQVVWDESAETLYSRGVALAEYVALRQGGVKVTFEIPEAFAARLGVPNAQFEMFGG